MGESNAYSVTFKSLTQDVASLITLHPSSEGTPGRPAGDPGPLLRSTVVLLHTAWENYVEQVALEGFGFLLSQIGDDHDKLHHQMRTLVGSTKNPWALAGSGWQSEARTILEKHVARLNTPNVANSEELFGLAFGASDILHSVSWQRAGNSTVVRKVNEFVHDIRGEIVHKGTTPGKLNKDGVKGWIQFFNNLVKQLDAKVADSLLDTTGTRPW